MHTYFVYQENDTGTELNTYYIATQRDGDALHNEWFENEKEATDYLEWFTSESAGV